MRILVLAGLLTFVPAAGFAIDCTTVAGNRVLSSCGFEDAADLAEWTLDNGSSAILGPGAGENGGAVLLTSTLIPAFSLSWQSPCLTADPNEPVSAGFVARLDGQGTAQCGVELQESSNETCLAFVQLSVGPVVAMTPLYQAVETSSFVLSPTTQSFRMRARCTSADGTFPIALDNAYVTGGLGSVAEVPTVGGVGLGLLGALIAIAAVLVLRARS